MQKEDKSKELSKSHVELNSRLSSVILIVNVIVISFNDCELFYHAKLSCNLVFHLVLSHGVNRVFSFVSSNEVCYRASK